MRCCSAPLTWLLAVERFIRAVLLGFAVWAVLKFRDAHDSIQAAQNRDLPAFRAVGIHVDQLALVRDLQKALDQAPSRLTLIAAGLAAYAVLELIEGTGFFGCLRAGVRRSVREPGRSQLGWADVSWRRLRLAEGHLVARSHRMAGSLERAAGSASDVGVSTPCWPRLTLVADNSCSR